jgi:hypothetical protein
MDTANDIARIDREWEVERQAYFIKDRYGLRQVPTSGLAVGVAVGGGGFGLVLTIMALRIAKAPAFGPLSISSVLFLLGVVFIVVAISFGIYCFSRAQEYEKAFAAYLSRRNKLLSESLP